MTVRMKRSSSTGTGMKKNVPESREISFLASPASACNHILDFFVPQHYVSKWDIQIVPGYSDCFVPQHYVSKCQHMSAYVSIPQHACGNVSIAIYQC
jgi:hypothetical protein